MNSHKWPISYTLLGGATACFAFWSVTLNQIEYVGTLAFMGLQLCLACWLIIGVVKLIGRVRQAFTFGSHNLADFVAGKTKRKPVENPLMRDPFYASVITQIEEARAKHKPVRHLYAKRDHRVNELLGKKGVA